MADSFKKMVRACYATVEYKEDGVTAHKVKCMKRPAKMGAVCANTTRMIAHFRKYHAGQLKLADEDVEEAEQLDDPEVAAPPEKKQKKAAGCGVLCTQESMLNFVDRPFTANGTGAPFFNWKEHLRSTVQSSANAGPNVGDVLIVLQMGDSQGCPNCAWCYLKCIKNISC